MCLLQSLQEVASAASGAAERDPNCRTCEKGPSPLSSRLVRSNTLPEPLAAGSSNKQKCGKEDQRGHHGDADDEANHNPKHRKQLKHLKKAARPSPA